jgi:uncharacterized membrane protein YdbT with pleckstrin-like domain
MQNTISENEYPVEPSWLLKTPISFFIITIFVCLFFAGGLILSHSTEILLKGMGYILVAILIFVIILMAVIGFISFIVTALSRDNFHFLVDKEFVIFHQGIISKQQKNLPYGVIQDVIINQDIVDRVLGLASLTIENASFGGGQVYVRGRQAGAMIGFVGNMAVIPGLTEQNAETLKNILLSKIKQFGSSSKAGL